MSSPTRTRSVGTALCLDTLEHCADPLAAVRELHRVLAPGGICVLSSVMFFPVHGYPHDYWRFTPEGMRLVLEPFAERWSRGIGHPELPMQVVGVGTKQRTLAALDLDGIRALTRRAARVGPRRGQGPLRSAARAAARAGPHPGLRAAPCGRAADPGPAQEPALTPASTYWKTKNGPSGVRPSGRAQRSLRQSAGRRRYCGATSVT